MKIVPVTKGKVAFVDDEDYERVTRYKWHTKPNGYAMRSYNVKGKRFSQYLHRFLMNPPPGKYVDHINHNRLDCRRENMRVVAPRQNSWNLKAISNKTSKYRGVHRSKRGWVSQITTNHRTYTLGCFKDEIEAALAYDRACRLTRGDFAVGLNFPPNGGWLAPNHDPRCLEMKP